MEAEMDRLLAALSRASAAGQPLPVTSTLPICLPPLSGESNLNEDDDELEVVVSASDNAKAKGDCGSTGDDAESIEHLLTTYLGAVRRVRQIDSGNIDGTATPPTAAGGPSVEASAGSGSSSSSASLESKLEALVKGLRVNDSDTWEGKPPQVSFAELVDSQRAEWAALMQLQGGDGDDDGAGPDSYLVEVVTRSAHTESKANLAVPGAQGDSTVEALFVQYAKELRSAPATVFQRKSEVEQSHADGTQQCQPQAAAADKSLAQLLDELDEMT